MNNKKSKIENLISKFCPFGVEFKELEQVFEIKNGYTPSKANPEYWTNGTIPWFRMDDLRGNGHVLNNSLQYITKEAVKSEKLFPANSIIVSTSATIGEHALITVPHLSNQRFTSLGLKSEYIDKLNMCFIYYYCYVLDEWCRNNTTKSNFASVDMAGFRKFKIPIPPLPIQEEIVKILDTFTELEAELEAELESRKKQYNFYIGNLFALNNVTEWKSLSEVIKIKRGVRVVKNQLEETGVFPVYQNSMKPLGYFDKRNFPSDTTFLISAGAAGDIGYSNVDFWAADDCFVFLCPDHVLSKFLYYFLKTKQDILYSNVRRASVPRLSRAVIEKIKIPIISLDEQSRIVCILDKFDALVNDISIGLPAELDARRKQYEYYRDKLLSFKEYGK